MSIARDGFFVSPALVTWKMRLSRSYRQMPSWRHGGFCVRLVSIALHAPILGECLVLVQIHILDTRRFLGLEVRRIFNLYMWHAFRGVISAT
jgi:hypothetical protein